MSDFVALYATRQSRITPGAATCTIEPPGVPKPMEVLPRVAKLFEMTQCVMRPLADREAMAAPPDWVFAASPTPMATMTALRRMQFVTVPPFSSMRTLPPLLSLRPPITPPSTARPERTAPALSSTKTRQAPTLFAPLSRVRPPAVLRTTTSAGSPVSPTMASASDTETAAETVWVPASMRIVSPSDATSTAWARVPNAAARVVPPLSSLPVVET